MRKIFAFAAGCLLIASSCQKNDVALPGDSNDGFETNLTRNADGTAANIQAGLQRSCAAHDVLQRQIANDPERGRRLDALERFIQERTATMKGKPGTGGETPTTRGLVSIPVVVHVVLPKAEAVSDAQIHSQISVLNADFQKKNAELSKSSVYLAGNNSSVVADCQVEFTIQKIIRLSGGPVATFGTNDDVKFTSRGGSDAINATTALNMWVCDLSSGYLGYAQFPGGASATDGVVIDYQAFGTTATYPMYADFNKGRTATHEVGHWLNLRHIWGDSRCGNDYVGDTPQHDGANYGCPGESDKSFCKGTVSKDMWMNYMDYTNDACMYMFTVNQKERMDVTLANARSSYYSTMK